MPLCELILEPAIADQDIPSIGVTKGQKIYKGTANGQDFYGLEFIQDGQFPCSEFCYDTESVMQCQIIPGEAVTGAGCKMSDVETDPLDLEFVSGGTPCRWRWQEGSVFVGGGSLGSGAGRGGIIQLGGGLGGTPFSTFGGGINIDIGGPITAPIRKLLNKKLVVNIKTKGNTCVLNVNGQFGGIHLKSWDGTESTCETKDDLAVPQLELFPVDIPLKACCNKTGQAVEGWSLRILNLTPGVITSGTAPAVDKGYKFLKVCVCEETAP